MRSIEWPLPAELLLTGLLLAGCAGVTTREEAAAPAPAAQSVDAATRQAYAEALTAMRAGQRAQAKGRLRRLIKAHPGFSGPYINLGILLREEQDLAGAEQALRRALELNPDNAIAYNQLGLLLRQQGRFQEAERAYQAAIARDPDYLLAHRNLGILFDLYLDRPAQALPHYERCQSLAPKPDKEIKLWIADLQRRLHKKKP